MKVMLLGAAKSKNVLLRVAKKKKGCYVTFKVKKGSVSEFATNICAVENRLKRQDSQFVLILVETHTHTLLCHSSPFSLLHLLCCISVATLVHTLKVCIHRAMWKQYGR